MKSDPTPQPPGDRALLGRASSSPFVVGRPLRASEPIFGREAAFRFVAGELTKFSSVNIVGERRMGRTSLLNHLVGQQDEHLVSQPGQPPLVLACLDLQRGVFNKERFYGLAVRELLDHLPATRSAEARDFQDLRERLHARPEAGYDELDRTLKRLRDPCGVCVRPVLSVDEFERLLDPEARGGFPFPSFFDGLRALITAELLAMVVASRRSLADCFRDPTRPGSLTSSFPTYFTPFALSALGDTAADALLLQPSDQRLTLQEVAAAKGWAGGHPCYLQAAGQAWYEAKVANRPPRWARRRFGELKSQSCMVGDTSAKASPWLRRLWRLLKALLITILVKVPILIGRLGQRLGARFDNIAAWIIGAILILLILLRLLGVATSGDLLALIKRGLGL